MSEENKKILDNTELGLDFLISKDKIPDCMIETFCISSIMAMQFDGLKLGEIFSNIANQCNKVFNIYEYKVEVFGEQLKTIFIKVSTQIMEMQKAQMQKLVNEQKTKKTTKKDK
jgi:hypothetical protein